jgi:hypothetical protein
MHVLDWLGSPQFMSQRRAMVAPMGFTVNSNAARRPKGRHESREGATSIGTKQMRWMAPAHASPESQTL